MHISILSSVVFHSSTAVDPAKKIADLVKNGKSVTISKDFEVQSGTEVYTFTKDTPFTAPIFDTASTYPLGQVVVHNGILQKITGSSGEAEQTRTRPKEPEEYAAWDEDKNFNTWTHRYFRVPNVSDADGWLTYMWEFDTRGYSIFWEGRGYGGCATGGWRFSAKDLTRTDSGNRCPSWYKRSCLRENYSEAYDAGKDVPADIAKFAAPCMVQKPTLNFHSMINRNGYFYFRTHVSDAVAPLEYVSNTVGSTLQYALTPITSPMDIDGFVYKRKTEPTTVFDGKNYTQCVQYPESKKVSFVFTNTEDFDTVALGRVVAERADIVVTDLEGNSVSEIKNYPLDNVVLKGYFYEAFTPVIYTDEVIKGEHIVTVTLHGNYVKIGDIAVGLSIDSGFTNLEFENDFKDFSPNEQDQWGNIYYVDGVRVHRHSGTVDIKITDYDKINRLRRMIGGNEVIVNGSDSKSNTPTNSKSIFQATMFIARFKTLKQKTRRRGNKMADTATYSFTLEERV